MKIDFIAYHSIHAQCGQSVFNYLSKYHECRWLMGPFASAPGGDGDAVVMLSHRFFHNFYKSRDGYKYLFHLSHDLADINLYQVDNLDDFDLIFVPTDKAFESCIQNGYGLNKIIKSGWPKYDLVEKLPKWNFLENFDEGKKTVIYAPSWVVNDEWKIVFDFFSKLDVNVIIKNHIMVDQDQEYPPGEEDDYKKVRKALDQMENQAKILKFNIAPRTMNIVELFLHSKAVVAVSDVSSCLLEFLPFGTSIETGGGDGPNDASKFSSLVKFIPADDLIKLDSEQFHALVSKEHAKEASFIDFDFNISYGQLIADRIHEHISNTKPIIRYRDTEGYFVLRKFIRRNIKKIIVLLIPKVFLEIIFSGVNKK